MNSRTTGPGSASLEELQTYWRMPSVRATRELAKQLRVRRVNRSCGGLEDSLGLSRGRQSRENPLGREPKATLPSPSAALATSPMILSAQHRATRLWGLRGTGLQNGLSILLGGSPMEYRRPRPRAVSAGPRPCRFERGENLRHRRAGVLCRWVGLSDRALR